MLHMSVEDADVELSVQTSILPLGLIATASMNTSVMCPLESVTVQTMFLVPLLNEHECETLPK